MRRKQDVSEKGIEWGVRDRDGRRGDSRIRIVGGFGELDAWREMDNDVCRARAREGCGGSRAAVGVVGVVVVEVEVEVESRK